MENINKYKELGMDAYLKAKRRAIINQNQELKVEVQKEKVKQEPIKKASKKSDDDSRDSDNIMDGL